MNSPIPTIIYVQVGRLDSEKPAAIRLSGASILEEHCYFDNNDGKVTLHALPGAVTVRGLFIPYLLDSLLRLHSS